EMTKSFRHVAKSILRNTLISSESLTPELRLRLITEQSSLWRSTPDLCPFVDPFWAFYWPGGQAVTRQVLGFEYFGLKVSYSIFLTIHVCSMERMFSISVVAVVPQASQHPWLGLTWSPMI
ncbi:hypothetical protein ANCDUO_25840, partial [Ancylostoma duodenale]